MKTTSTQHVIDAIAGRDPQFLGDGDLWLVRRCSYWLDELYEEYKDPSFCQLKNWEFEIARNHKGNLYLYSDKSMQSPYVSNRYEQELFMTTTDNKIFMALSICAKNCNGNTGFFELIEPTDLYVNSNRKNENNIDDDNIVNQLEQLNSLYKSGVLTKEEFEKAKKKILN